MRKASSWARRFAIVCRDNNNVLRVKWKKIWYGMTYRNIF